MNKLKFPDKITEVFLHQRLLVISLAAVFFFCLGFPYPSFLFLGKLTLLLLLIAVVTDLSLLFKIRQPVKGSRVMENKLSNGDYNPVIIQLQGKYNFTTSLEIIDEFPVQLQLRNKRFTLENVSPSFAEEIVYQVRPTQRGDYNFGNLLVFISTPLRLVKRRVIINAETTVKVYPSFIQYRKFSFLTISNRLDEAGVKKVRKLGASQEFEQIRDYVRGDDYRIINWKATARRNELMVNQYQEEKAQNVYCLIDKGRLMHMPFDGLSLIDYAINSTLVMAGIAIGRGDKAGMITFSDKINSFIPAQSGSMHMNSISDTLYNQEVTLRETDYLRLYKNIRMHIRKRSLLILFTNFDSLISLKRQIKFLRAIAKNHLLCMVIFDNTEINIRADKPAYTLKDAYRQTVAEKFQHDKRLIVRELNKNGIYSILTEPQGLTVNTINKYIELKATGAI